MPVSTLTDAYIYTCRYGGADYFFAVHGSLNAISRSSFKGAELPEYFVRTMTVVWPSGSDAGTRAMIWPGLLTDRRLVVLYSVPSAALKNTPDKKHTSVYAFYPEFSVENSPYFSSYRHPAHFHFP